MNKRFYIYSNIRKEYWRKDAKGYTKSEDDAGHYTGEEIVELMETRDANAKLSVTLVPDELLRTEEQELELDVRLIMMREGLLPFS